jgi:nucleotide-binding universal stress UspA family protein
MSYKTILVHLDSPPRSAEWLALAFGLAAQFEAHLVGLYAPGARRIPSYALAEAGLALRDLLEQRWAENTRQAEKQFRDAAARHGNAGAEWRASDADAAAAVCLSARYADLVVAAQPEPQDAAETRFLAEELALSVGRPVLFVPYAGRFAAAGKRVLIAWDGGREAARAVSDALPFLERAEAVEVAVFDAERGRRDHGEQPGADIGLYLARHGVKVTVHRQSGAGFDVGAQILSRAADTGSDLIVMGAYGHSRVRELVLGGVTRSMLEAMTVPVLMSH